MKKSGAVLVDILVTILLALAVSLGASHLMSNILGNFAHIQERSKNSLDLLSVIETMNVAAFDLSSDICSLHNVTVDDNLSLYHLSSFMVSVSDKYGSAPRKITWRVWDIRGR